MSILATVILIPLLASATGGLYQFIYPSFPMQQLDYNNYNPSFQRYAEFYNNYQRIVDPKVFQQYLTTPGAGVTFGSNGNYFGQHTGPVTTLGGVGNYLSHFKYNDFAGYKHYYDNWNRKFDEEMQQLYRRYGFQNTRRLVYHPVSIGNDSIIEPKIIEIKPSAEKVVEKVDNVEKLIPIVGNREAVTVIIPTSTEMTTSSFADTTTTLATTTEASKNEDHAEHDENKIVVDINDYIEYKPNVVDEEDENLDEREDDYNYEDEDTVEEKVTEKPKGLFGFFS